MSFFDIVAQISTFHDIGQEGEGLSLIHLSFFCFDKYQLFINTLHECTAVLQFLPNSMIFLGAACVSQN